MTNILYECFSSYILRQSLVIFEFIKLLLLDTKFRGSACFHLPSADLQSHTVAWLLTWVPGLPSADLQTHILDTVAWLSTRF